MNNLENWCESLKRFWQNKEIDKIINLFDDNVIYYETPNCKLESINQVREAWNEIKEQNTNNIEMKVLCEEDNKCIANFILKDELTYDMIYEIELNDTNKCIYFKQWYMEL